MIRLESICCCCTLNTNCACVKTAKTDRVGFLCGLFFPPLCFVPVCNSVLQVSRRLEMRDYCNDGLIDEENATRPKCCSHVALSKCHTHLRTHILGNMHYTLDKHTKEKRDTYCKQKVPRRHFSRGETQNDSNIVCVRLPTFSQRRESVRDIHTGTWLCLACAIN